MPKYSYQRDPLTQKEVGEAILALDTMPFRALIAFLYLWGTRISEALRMEKADFKILKTGVKAHIKIEKKKKGSPLISAHDIQVGLNAPFISELVSYLNQAPEGKLWRFGRMTAWRKIQRALGVSPHFFRHTRASRLAEKTDNPFVLVDWFGWANANPATRYIQMSGRLAARLSNKIE